MRLLSIALGCALLLGATPGLAQSTNKAEEAAALSVVAAAKAKAGQHRLCAEMFEQAYKLDPSFLGYLYSAARCRQKAKDLDGAERGYRAFLARAPAEHPLRGRAESHLAEIVKLREAQASPTATTGSKADGAGKSGDGAGANKTGPIPPQKPSRPTNYAAWATLIGGGVIALGGIGTLVLGASERQALEDDLTRDPASGLIGGLDHATAVQRAGSVNNLQYIGFALTGLGLLGAGAGLVLFHAEDETKTARMRLMPSRDGFVLAGSF